MDNNEVIDALRPVIRDGMAFLIRDFANAILHGDDRHRAWLLRAAEFYIAGKPIPAAVDNDGELP